MSGMNDQLKTVRMAIIQEVCKWEMIGSYAMGCQWQELREELDKVDIDALREMIDGYKRALEE